MERCLGAKRVITKYKQISDERAPEVSTYLSEYNVKIKKSNNAPAFSSNMSGDISEIKEIESLGVDHHNDSNGNKFFVERLRIVGNYQFPNIKEEFRLAILAILLPAFLFIVIFKTLTYWVQTKKIIPYK